VQGMRWGSFVGKHGAGSPSQYDLPVPVSVVGLGSRAPIVRDELRVILIRGVTIAAVMLRVLGAADCNGVAPRQHVPVVLPLGGPGLLRVNDGHEPLEADGGPLLRLSPRQLRAVLTPGVQKLAVRLYAPAVGAGSQVLKGLMLGFWDGVDAEVGHILRSDSGHVAGVQPQDPRGRKKMRKIHILNYYKLLLRQLHVCNGDLNFNTRLDGNRGNLLDNLRRRVQINQTLMNTHFEAIPGL